SEEHRRFHDCSLQNNGSESSIADGRCPALRNIRTVDVWPTRFRRRRALVHLHSRGRLRTSRTSLAHQTVDRRRSNHSVESVVSSHGCFWISDPVTDRCWYHRLLPPHRIQRFSVLRLCHVVFFVG